MSKVVVMDALSFRIKYLSIKAIKFLTTFKFQPFYPPSILVRIEHDGGDIILLGV